MLTYNDLLIFMILYDASKALTKSSERIVTKKSHQEKKESKFPKNVGVGRLTNHY